MRHAYSDANGNGHIHSDGDCDGNCHIHPDGNRDGYVYANTDANSNCVCITAAFTDATASADAAAACGLLLFR